MRVAFVLRSVEVQPLFRDLCKAATTAVALANPPTPTPLTRTWTTNGHCWFSSPSPSPQCCAPGSSVNRAVRHAQQLAKCHLCCTATAVQPLFFPVVGWCPAGLVQFQARQQCFCSQMVVLIEMIHSLSHPGVQKECPCSLQRRARGCNSQSPAFASGCSTIRLVGPIPLHIQVSKRSPLCSLRCGSGPSPC